MATKELLKELPSRDERNFSNFSSKSHNRSKIKEYVKIGDEDFSAAQEITCQRDAYLVTALKAAHKQQQQQNDQVEKIQTKRSPPSLVPHLQERVKLRKVEGDVPAGTSIEGNSQDQPTTDGPNT